VSPNGDHQGDGASRSVLGAGHAEREVPQDLSGRVPGKKLSVVTAPQGAFRFRSSSAGASESLVCVYIVRCGAAAAAKSQESWKNRSIVQHRDNAYDKPARPAAGPTDRDRRQAPGSARTP